MIDHTPIKVSDSRHRYIIVRQTFQVITIETTAGDTLLLINPHEAESLGKALFHAASEARK